MILGCSRPQTSVGGGGGGGGGGGRIHRITMGPAVRGHGHPENVSTVLPRNKLTKTAVQPRIILGSTSVRPVSSAVQPRIATLCGRREV
jgi:hypothetical protein